MLTEVLEVRDRNSKLGFPMVMNPGLPACQPTYANLMSNCKVIELLLQLKSAKDHGKNYITVKPHLARHLLRNRV